MEVPMGKLLWQPTRERIESTNMVQFVEYGNRRFGKTFRTYDDLYRWSVTEIPTFWDAMWNFGEVIASTPYKKVVDDIAKMPGAKWFDGARLNFAENLLR